MTPTGLPPITQAFPTGSVNAVLTTVLSGSGLATSLLPSSSVLPVAPDVDPSGSRGVEAVSSQLRDATVDNEPRGGETVPPSPEKGGEDVGNAGAETLQNKKPGCSRELSVKFATPLQQRQGGRSPTLHELMDG